MMSLKNGCLTYIVWVAIANGISYLITAGLLYLIMWGLTALGVTLPIVWTWGLSAVVWLILLLLKCSFNVTVNK